VKCVNYRSNNNFAEHLLVKSASTQNKMIKLDEASVFLKLFWKRKLGSSAFTFKDGSGLSRLNLSSPILYNQLLSFQLNSKSLIKETFMSSLPVAGISGTLKSLGNGTTIEGKFIGKSGSMSGVRCYSGYFKKSSDYFPFTIMINNFISSDYVIKKHIEQLMTNIYENL
jgi:D-alanyl-D-alanine carboxypeptidase/D-alanyl-D-alanine-endopeptidase (penicillin-binding protein 4)